LIDGESKSKEASATASSPEEGMTFTEHLGELRTRIIYSIVFLILGCFVSFPLIKPFLFPFMMRPMAGIKDAEIQVLGPSEKFMAYFKVGIAAGLVIALPLVLYQLWLFVRPGLKQKEKRWVKGLLWSAVFLFLAGAAFSFFLMLPIALRFLLTFNPGYDIKTQITLDRYFSFTLFLVLAGGLVFQIPLITFFLSLIGLVSPHQMSKYRKYAILATVILAAALTPTGDPVTLSVMGLPIYLLYEISIFVSRAVYKGKAAAVEKASE